MHSLVGIVVGILLWLVQQHSYWNDVQQSTNNWTQPIRSPLINATLLAVPMEELVTPTVQDVLISTRLSDCSSNHLHAQAHILDYHTGNRMWKETLGKDMKGNNKDIAYVRKLLGSDSARFLQQVENGWLELKDEQRETLGFDNRLQIHDDCIP